MKFALIIAMTIATTVVSAGTRFICIELNGDRYEPKKMILTQVTDEEVVEGKRFAFKLEIFQGNASKPIVSESVNVKTEDVMFRFTNTAKKISGMIYMDELDQTWLKIGKVGTNFNCN